MISILDCTLRDGGYVNSFLFGDSNITKIIKLLTNAKIEFIECGFLKAYEQSRDMSLYASVEAIERHITDKESSMYVAMIAYGDIPIGDIGDWNGKSIDGIRLTFHANEIEDAFIYAEQLMLKGYKVFIQPVGTLFYTDEQLLGLIKKVNDLKPFAFYLVDTLGNMYKNDLLRMFYLTDNNLDHDISIGFHSHNNLQLSFSNAQELILLNSKRNIIIDSSVLGLGRGAGNLCTELLLQYINENIENKYDLIPILEIMDENIMPLYNKYKWGYSASYYLAAINNCHPNYATYLINKQTLCIKDIKSIIEMIPFENRYLYNQSLIKEIYNKYQSHNIDDSITIGKLKELLKNRNVLILAPGKSIVDNSNDVYDYIKKTNPIVIGVNHYSKLYEYDRIFVSNLKRYKQIDEAVDKLEKNFIFTSNILQDEYKDIVNYQNILNDEELIADDAGLMAINLLYLIGVKSVALAGYDGFANGNYFDENFEVVVEDQVQTLKVAAIQKYFARMKRKMDIIFITPTVYIEGNEK